MSFVEDLWKDVSGQTAADAQAKAGVKAAQLQEARGQEAIGLLTPFREFGQAQLDPLSQLLSAQGQAAYLQDNPLFQNILDSVNRQTMLTQAARGRLGSGGTLESLQSNYLMQALPFLQNQQQNLFQAANMGQTSAAGVGNILQNIGNVQGAGEMARVSNQGVGTQAAVQLGAAALGAMGGNPFAAMGLGGFGGGVPPKPNGLPMGIKG